MKKIWTLFAILAVAGICVYSTAFYSKTQLKTEKHTEKGTENEEEFTKDRMLWEYLRMRDPQTGKIPSGIRTMELDFVRRNFLQKSNKNMPSLLSDAPWYRRGPFEIGGRTRALGIDPRNENIIIAGGVSGGMWRSTDGGTSWAKTSRPDQLLSVSCLAQDTRQGKQDTWYYGTGEYFGNSAGITGDGIYKSTDNGKSWSVLPNTAGNAPNRWENQYDYVWNLATNPAAPANIDEIVVATASSGIFRSTNGGTNWNRVLAGGGAFADIAISKTGVYYATISSSAGLGDPKASGIFRSVDGVNWTNITPDNFPKAYNRIVIGIAPSDENQVYFVGETPGSGLLTINTQGDSLYHNLWKYTYVSGDGTGSGGTWENRTENLPKPVLLRGQMNSQWGYDLVIKVKPDDPDVVILGAVTLYRSKDGFKTNNADWIGGTCPFDNCDYDYRYPNHHSDLHCINFLPSNPNVLFTGSDGGVHKTLDDLAETVDWISLNNGYFTTQFYTIAIDHSGQKPDYIIGGLQDNGTLMTSTQNVLEPWSNPSRGDGFYCQIPPGAPYVVTSQNTSWQPKIRLQLVKQDDNGKVLVTKRIDPIGGKDFIWNTPFMLDPNNPNRLYLAGGKMIWRNNDLSGIPLEESKDSINTNWDSLSHTRIDYIQDVSVAALGERITAISVSRNPANVVYYGTSSGNIYRIDNADKGDPVPINIKGPAIIGNPYTSSFSINPDNAMDVIVSFSNYNVISMYHSTDGGINWESIGGNLEEKPDGSGAGPLVNWVQTLKTSTGYVYFAGTSVGLFATSYLNGSGTIWRLEGTEEIGNVVIDMIDTRDSDGFVAVGTHGAGIFSTNYTVTGTAPGNISLIRPSNDTSNIGSKLTFVWSKSASAVTYDLEYSTDPNFHNDVDFIKGIKDTTVSVTTLKAGFITYYWRVRAINSYGAGNWTESRNFQTTITAPELIVPPNGEKDTPLEITLQWNAAAGADLYRLEVAAGLGFGKLLVDTIIAETSYTISGLEKKTRYNWRLTSLRGNIKSSASQAYYFVTRDESGIADSKAINTSIFTYPNPYSGSFTVNFNYPEMQYAIINLYDESGRIVKELWSGLILPGTNRFDFNTPGFAKGMYFLSIELNGKAYITTVTKFE